jgi:uncharacterized protein involved in exopolysaccharide biosynthesis
MEEKNGIIKKEDLFFDFKQLWQLFKKNWKWISFSVFVCLLIAGLYIWFTPTTLKVAGKMEIIDKSKKGSSSMSSNMALLNSLPLNIGSSLGGVASLGIDDEKEVLMSTMLVRNVVKDLGLYTEYRLSKWGRKTLLYQNNPITVSLDSAHVQWFDTELPLVNHQILLTVTKSSNGYRVKTRLVENKEKTDLPTQTFATLPATIETEVGTLTITENILPPKQAKQFNGDYTLKVSIIPPTKRAQEFVKRLWADPPSKKVMNILSISVREENLMRGIDFITGLVEAYNQRANEDKNEEARKTDEFVSVRLAKIDVELGSSDDAWENSKKNFQITSPEIDAEETINKKSYYETQLVDIGTQLQLHDYLDEYINNPANLYEIIPLWLGGNRSYPSLISQHNTLVGQRNDLLKSVSEKSPQIQRLTQSIQELHPTLQLAMKRDREQLVMQKNTLEREYAKYTGRVGTTPKMERVLTEIGREREIKQAVYLVLLQKREEAAMELANTTDKGRLIDDVNVVDSSTKPIKKMVLLVAIFLGALIPMGVIFILYILKTKIDNREELVSQTALPFLTEIPATDNDEAFRNLRTLLLLHLKPGQKTLLIASQNDEDGKTFIAHHLVDSLNTIGKKTVYVNGDLRKLEKGYPADILASEDFAKQMAQSKAANDYLIIDSPALGQYTDALQLAQFADATLYVVKAGRTMNSEVVSLNESRLPQPMLVFNNYTIKK